MRDRAIVRVLLVEDNPADARLVRALLMWERSWSFDVSVVDRVSAAVQHVGTSPVDAVLLDLSLPDSQGMETVRVFRQAAPDVPVIVLTGLEDGDVGLQAIKEGCQDYLVKGQGDGGDIAKAIVYSIERKRLERELVRAKEQYRLLVDTSPDAILICTADDVRFVNKASRRLCNSPDLELKGREFAALVAPHDVPRVGALIKEVLSGTRQSGVIEAQLRACDGRLVEAEIVVLAIDNNGGRAAEVVIHDLAARHEADHYRIMAATVFNGSAEAMIVTDAETRVCMVNAAFTDITGYQPEEVIGRTPHMLSSGKHPPEFFAEMWRTLLESGRWRGDIWNRRKNGEVYVQRLSISVIRGHDGKVVNYIGVFSDVTQQRQKEDSVRHKAFHDALTGLPNRALLEDRLQQAMVQACRREGGLAVLFVDLDEFKPVNDRYGHRAGDEVLRYVARTLKACVREVDTVARIGGDEFVVVLTDVTEGTGVESIARLILDSLKQPLILDAATVSVSGSIGIAMFPGNGGDSACLLANADAAMYEAKRGGRGTYRFFGGYEGGAEWEPLNALAIKA